MIDIKSLDPNKTLVVATGNAHKVVEIKAILADLLEDTEIVALGELGEFADPVEDGATFNENAYIKAAAALNETGFKQAIADDSGLVVDALNGAPGILSARYAGEHGNDKLNNEKLLAELEKVGATTPEKRSAHFHASIVFITRDIDGEEVLTGEGDVFGHITFKESGCGGFGYDPLFVPDNQMGHDGTATFADFSPEEKNAISHRSLALQDLARKL